MTNDIIISQLREMFKGMIEEVLREERREYLKEHPETRGNGYYVRRPKTIMGEMEIRIPRSRDSGYKPEILPERKRVMFMLDEIIRAMFISGISTRKTVKVISNLIGASVSAQFVSQAIEIGEKEMEKWKRRFLELKYPVLYIDATYIPLKRESVEKEAVYVIMGLREDGKREILGYFIPGGGERTFMWREIFRELKERGLRGVKMIISDDLRGLREVIPEEFPGVMHQLCWFHLKRNIKNRVRRRHWGEILKELNEIIRAKDPSEGEERLKEFIDKWSRIYRFMKNLEEKTKHYTHFLRAPMEIRSYFRTTNWMERLFKELKDYLRVRGFLQNEISAEKFLYVFFKEKSERYENRSLRYSDTVINFLSSLENGGAL